MGQNSREEVEIIVSGRNCGWPALEGSQCLPLSPNCDPSDLILPIAECGRAEGFAVSGGHVCRGVQQTPAWGDYIFGDFGSGAIWTLKERPAGFWRRSVLAGTNLSISSFGEDEAGEL